MIHRVNGKTKLFAVIGDPIEHSLSPQIHNSIFDHIQENSLYIPLQITESQLQSSISMIRNNFLGFNVTIPHKEKIIPYLDDLDERAKWYGAVNTVKMVEGKLIGYNTDGYGWMKSLEAEGVDLKDKEVLLLGAGGAARAAAYEILLHGGKLTIANRSLDRAIRLQKELEEHTRREDIQACLLDEVEKNFFAVVNATPVGMYPEINEMPIAENVLEKVQLVYDMVYNPYETQLLKAAKKHGCKTMSGLSMLFYQGVKAQEIWRGQTLDPKLLDSLYQELEAYIQERQVR